jgi:surfactin synthase thioesterase subunit
MSGGHFFILEHTDKIVEVISDKLLSTQIIKTH